MTNDEMRLSQIENGLRERSGLTSVGDFSNGAPLLLAINEISGSAGDDAIHEETVIKGIVERGTVTAGQEVELVGIDELEKAICAGIEIAGKQVRKADAGEEPSITLSGVEVDDVAPGQVLAQPGSIKPYRHFEGVAYMLREDEGGRNEPLTDGLRFGFRLRTADVTGSIELPDKTNVVALGKQLTMTVFLNTRVALESGLRFDVQEHGNVVGIGLVTKLIV